MKLSLTLMISAVLLAPAAQAASLNKMSCRQLAGLHNQLVKKIVAYGPYYRPDGQKIFDLRRLQRVYSFMWMEKRCDMRNSGLVSLSDAYEEREARRQQRYRNECFPFLDGNQREAYDACVDRIRNQ